MGGDVRMRNESPSLAGFNPRPRMGGDLTPPFIWSSNSLFQSTPPHGGRHAWASPNVVGAEVSIHAPAWGATPARFVQQTISLFQSTPPHGGRRTPAGHRPIGLGFQSTPPHGGRQPSQHRNGWKRNVSIHAPAWGATSPMQAHKSLRKCFNPRPRMGGDFSAIYWGPLMASFNPRPRMGGDQSLIEILNR